ncbi:hypothetical protein D3C71_1316190 [compost metagenome]
MGADETGTGAGAGFRGMGSAGTAGHGSWTGRAAGGACRSSGSGGGTSEGGCCRRDAAGPAASSGQPPGIRRSGCRERTRRRNEEGRSACRSAPRKKRADAPLDGSRSSRGDCAGRNRYPGRKQGAGIDSRHLPDGEGDRGEPSRYGAAVQQCLPVGRHGRADQPVRGIPGEDRHPERRIQPRSGGGLDRREAAAGVAGQ